METLRDLIIDYIVKDCSEIQDTKLEERQIITKKYVKKLTAQWKEMHGKNPNKFQKDQIFVLALNRKENLWD